MSRQFILCSIWLFPIFMMAQSPKGLVELDEAGFRRIAKENIAFVNFNNPTCDLGQYYNDDIVKVNERVPAIPIYYFDLTKYPSVKEEFKLYGLDRLTALSYGKKLEKYEGFLSYNILEAWLIGKWNQQKRTNLPIRKYRSKSYAAAPSGIDVEAKQRANFLFEGSGKDEQTGEQKFRVINNGKKVFEYKNNVLYSTGDYRDSDATTSGVRLENAKQLTLYYEFMPLSDKFNAILCGDRYSRYFTLEIIDKQLCIMLENGNWRYIAKETEIEKGSWNAIAISLDYANRQVEVVLNGKKLDHFILDKDVELKNASTNFGLINYGSGAVFYGFVNQLKMYDGAIKGGDLVLLYNNERRNYPDISDALPSDKVAYYDFSSLQNKVSKSDFMTPNASTDLVRDKLYIKPEEGDYSSWETETFRFSNDKFTIALDFELEKYAYEDKAYNINPMSWFFSITDGRKDYISTRIDNGELDLRVGVYPGEKIRTTNANIQLNQKHNLVLSFDLQTRLLQVLLDGRIILSEYISEMVSFNEVQDRLVFSMVQGAPYRFQGTIDNLQIYSKSYKEEKLKKLSQGESIE